MIEARGGKHPYVYAISASRLKGTSLNRIHGLLLDTADSEDEAYGRAMKAACLAFPRENGFQGHHANVLTIGGFDWVGRHDFTQIIPHP